MSLDSHGETVDAVIVAGGRGSRLGGAVKADLRLDGDRLIDRILNAVRSARTIVVVGEGIEVPAHVLTTIESPPLGGPAAGAAAGLHAIADPAEWTLLLAGDLADPPAGVGALLTAAHAAPADIDGYCLAGSTAHPQWLFGIHRSTALRAVLAGAGVRDRSMASVLSPLRLRTIAVDPREVADIDTEQDLRAWGVARPPAPPAQTDKHEGPGREGAATRARWAAWVELAAEAAGVDPADVDVAGIHTLTRQIAHGYDRPLAPVGSYILGLAVGAARARGEDLDVEAARRSIAATLAVAPPKQEEGP